MKKINLFLILIFILSFSFFISAAEFSKEDAKKIDRFLKKAKKRYAPEAKYVKLNLERKNSVSGKLKLKLKGKKYSKVPSFLKDIDLQFSGIIECEDYKMRLIFSKLTINGSEYDPQVLDEAFSAYQVKQKVKKSMFDWFKLLPGLRNIQITKRRITLYY